MTWRFREQDVSHPYQALADRLRPILPRVALDTIDPDAHAMRVLPRDLAWSHRTMPLYFHNRALVCATTVDHLPRAMALLDRFDVGAVDFVIADENDLTDTIVRHYGVGYLDLSNPDHCRVA